MVVDIVIGFTKFDGALTIILKLKPSGICFSGSNIAKINFYKLVGFVGYLHCAIPSAGLK